MSIAASQTVPVSFMTRLLVTVIAYSIAFRIATYLPQAIAVKWYSAHHEIQYIQYTLTRSKPQKCSNETCRASNKSILPENGIVTTPTRRSATARLDNRMYEFFWNRLSRFTIRTTRAFKKMVMGEAKDFMPTKIHGKVVSFKILCQVWCFCTIKHWPVLGGRVGLRLCIVQLHVDGVTCFSKRFTMFSLSFVKVKFTMKIT